MTAPAEKAKAPLVYKFGDPCRRCCAGSADPRPINRECFCVACPTCGEPTGTLCGYCGESLGCRAHPIRIVEHVARCKEADRG